MRAGPTSILPGACVLALAAGLLSGCGPTGIDSDSLNPQVSPVNPELATLPDIEVLADLPYGEDPLQSLDACLPPDEGTATTAVDPGEDTPGADLPEAPGADLPAAEPPRRAAILVVHGGSWRRGDKADVAWRSLCQWLASNGYVAFSANYRLAPAAIFPAAIDDIRSAVEWLRDDLQVERFHLDPQRIGAFGGSAGGNLVSLLGTSGSGDLTSGTRVAAVAELSAPIDLTGLAVTDDFAPVQLSYLGCETAEECPAAVAASPFYTIDASDPPFFVAHSTDEMIPLAQAEIFVAGLRAAGVPVDFVTVEGTRHATAMVDAELKRRILAFFDQWIGTPDAPVVGDGAG